MAVFCSLVIANTGLKMIHDDISMTGEIDLCGNVLGVVSIGSKLEHAVSSGRRKVVLPRANLEEAMKLKLEKNWEGLELLDVGNIRELVTRVFPVEGDSHGE